METKTSVQPDLFGAAETVTPLRPPTPPPGRREGLRQVAPGKWLPRDGRAPESVIAEVFRHADGTLGLRPGPYGRLAKISRVTAKALGIEKYMKMIKRLGAAGFVDLYHPSPNVYMLDLDSWFRHLDATAEDPDFWDPDGDNFHQYVMKNGLRADR